MRIVVIGAPDLSRALAEHLHLERVGELAEIASDGFVLDGTALTVPEARALDAVLRTRAAEVDAVLWVAGGDPAVLDHPLLDHYMGRVLELDAGAETFEQALDGLREVLLAA